MLKRSNKPNLDILTKIKEKHYKWCLDNGRNVAWYKEIKKMKDAKKK